MFRARIIPKSQRAKNRVNEHGEVMKVLRQDKPQCFNGLDAIFVESEDSKRWQGWFSVEDADYEKLPNEPMSEQAKGVFKEWYKQLAEEKRLRHLEHQKMMMQHKKKRK